MMSKEKSNGKVLQVNYGQFDSEVLRSTVPVFVDFYADWCGPCQTIGPTLEALSEEYADKVKFVKVNVDDNQEVAMKYEIMGIPTAMIFRNGTAKDTLVGAFPAATYRKTIERVLNA